MLSISFKSPFKDLPHILGGMIFMGFILGAYSCAVGDEDNDTSPRDDFYYFSIPEPECQIIHNADTTNAFIDSTMSILLTGDDHVEIIDLGAEHARRDLMLGFEPIWWASTVPKKQCVLALQVDIHADSTSDSTIHCVDIASGETQWKYKCDSAPGVFAVTQDGNRLAVSFSIYEYQENIPEEDRTLTNYAHRSWIELIDIGTGMRIDNLKCSTRDGIASLAFSNDGSRLAVGGGVACSVVLWNLETQEEKILFEIPQRDPASPSKIYSIVFSPDDRLLIASGRCALGFKEEDRYGGGMLFVWDSVGNRVKMFATSHKTTFDDVSFDTTNNFFVTTEQKDFGDDTPDYALLGRALYGKTTVFKCWDRHNMAPVAEFEVGGVYDLAPLITDENVLHAISFESKEKKKPPPLDMPWVDIPIRVKRCEWSLDELKTLGADS